MEIITVFFIALGFLVPSFASAKSTPKDTTPPSVTSVHIASTNANPTQARSGDTVTLTFVASEKVTPIALVETKTLFVKAKNSTGNSWDATYVVSSRDPKGRVDYLLTLIDAAGNISICASFRLPFIKYCPPTDGSSVTVVAGGTTPPPGGDTAAPVISAHSDVFATTTGTSTVVSYTGPAANDAHDGVVTPSCAPASGSTFSVGSTTVMCTAGDAAGNTASTTFAVGVTHINPPVPVPYVMGSQPTESFLCGSSWQFCNDAEEFSFTNGAGVNKFNQPTGTFTTNLGLGSTLGGGTLQTVTIAKDKNNPNTPTHPWLITIHCYTNSSYSLGAACPDWVAPATQANRLDLFFNHAELLNRTDVIGEEAATSPDLGLHWVADFSNPVREQNYDGTTPITFNPNYYYQLVIDDLAWDVGAWGSESLHQPYWVITGLK